MYRIKLFAYIDPDMENVPGLPMSELPFKEYAPWAIQDHAIEADAERVAKEIQDNYAGLSAQVFMIL